MNIKEIDEVIACLPKGKTIFPYFQGRYASMLLAWLFYDNCTVAEVKKSTYAGLLQKPSVQDVLADSGNGTLCVDALSMAWAEPHDQFLLTLGKWGGDSRRWQQTSRAGHNLVLQLNVHEGYRRSFEKNLPDRFKFMLGSSAHPVLNRGEQAFFRQTLGWVRMDIDFNTGEALIEEIQSDWIRDLRYLRKSCSKTSEYKAAETYCDFVVNRFNKIWDEALLCAALWFIREEMGLRTIWYHTFETGNQLKRIRYSYPPRSLYTKLPRKFCFTQTHEQPLFLAKDKSYKRSLKAMKTSKSNVCVPKEPRWFQMQL